ncbi:hypothetical protein ACIBCT_03640 [Streptosporangium sp. NPDC050855]|uniref:hypothetical protein n=1 Tax=Streptosporangium sp. NPDC050855 TaxID=3366194 RepID=UPI0037BB36C4
MNEFKIISDVMPDVPPSDPREVAGIRTMALEGGSRPRTVPARPVAGRLGGRFGWAVAAVATAAVVAVVTVVPRLQAAAPSPAVEPPAALEVVAGLMAERKGPGSGRYWRTTRETTTRTKTVKGYFVNDRARVTTWRSATGRSKVEEYRLVGVEPAGPADLAAWRRAGSPALCEGGKSCAGGSLRPGRTRYVSDSREKARYLYGGLLGTGLDMVKITKLPDDPVALRSALLRSWPAFLSRMEQAGVEPVMSRDEWLWWTGVGLLQDAPTSPPVRAALYRVLADVPGARVLDDARTVTVARRNQDGLTDHHVVIDRTTGEVSAVRQVSPGPDPRQKAGKGLPKGSVTFESTLLSAGWTDEAPALPDGCERGTCVR